MLEVRQQEIGEQGNSFIAQRAFQSTDGVFYWYY